MDLSGIVSGIIVGVVVTSFGHWLPILHQPRVRRKTLHITKGTPEIKEAFRVIYEWFVIGQTRLLDPPLSDSGYSSHHSHHKNGYFDYLIKCNVPSYHFRFYSKDGNRFVEVLVDGKELHLTTRLLKYEHRGVVKRLQDDLC